MLPDSHIVSYAGTACNDKPQQYQIRHPLFQQKLGVNIAKLVLRLPNKSQTVSPWSLGATNCD